MKQAWKRRTALWMALVGLFAGITTLYYAVFIANAETAPPPPHTFTVIDGGDGSSLYISWNYPDVTEAAALVLYRSEDDSNYVKVQESALTAYTYKDTGLLRGKTYYYRLYAKDGEGNETALSAASASIASFVSERNLLTNSHFESDTSDWVVGAYELYTDDEAFSKASISLVSGYEGNIQNAGHTYHGQGKAVKLEINGSTQKAKTTLYQRKLDLVPTGEPVQLSFAWKKACQCEATASQTISIEFVRPDTTWVTVWRDETIGSMDQYAVEENLDITPYIAGAGTYELRMIVEQETGPDSSSKNEVFLDEVFLDFPTGPKAPNSLQLSVEQQGQALHLSWEKAEGEDLEGYYIYRSTEENGAYNRVSETPITDTSYIDTGLQNGQTYYYYVTSFGSDVESQKSKTVKGVPLFIDALNHPHSMYTDNTKACASCHLSHKAKSESIVKEDSETKLCLTCHDGTGSAYDISGEFTEKTVSSHPIMQTTSTPDGTMKCSSCHNPHAANGSRTTTEQVSGSLSRVSGVETIYNKTPFTNPVHFTMKKEITKTTELCFTCHSNNPDTPVETKATATAKEFHPSNSSGHHTAGDTNLSGFGAYVNGWTATTATTCTDCHGSTEKNTAGVHGSENTNLLKGAFSAEATATDTDMLCLSCHSKSSYGGHTSLNASMNTVGETRFKQKTENAAVGAVQTGINLHNFWNEETNSGHLGVACAQCHSAVPHSTERLPAMLVDSDDPAPYQSYTTNTNLTIYYPADGAWSKNSCGTTGGGCHLNEKEEE